MHKTASFALGLPVAFWLGALVQPAACPSSHGPCTDLSQVVAVVDIAKIRNAYPRADILEEALKADQTKVELALKSGAQELEKLKLDLKTWDPFSEPWIEAQKRISGTEAGLQALREMEERRLVIDRFENHERIYHDIDRAITLLAEKRKLQLVLRINEVPDAAQLPERVDMWRLKTVFYRHHTLDLTEDVIKFLQSPEFAGDADRSSDGK